MSLKVVQVEVGELRAQGQEQGQKDLFVERDILERIGVYMQGVTSRAFLDQGRGGLWPKRMTPSVPAIVKQLNRGQNPSQKYFKPAPALIDTGTLSRSIAYEVKGRGVEVGSAVPYASKMQEGGSSQITLTKGGRRVLAEWLQGLPRARRKKASASLGWLFRRPTFTVTARARPFLMVTDADRDEFAEIVAEELAAAQ